MGRSSVAAAGEPAMQVPRVPDRGEPDDFAVFYAAELAGLVTLARALCGAASADDVAQEAMLAAYRRWPEIGRYDEPRAWVRRACANIAISTFRRRLVELRALPRLAGRAEQPRADDATEDFWAAVRQLPRRQAQCAALRFIYELSGAEIARTLDITEGSVKVHLARARLALSVRLELPAVTDEEDRT